jgi:superfamily II DNA/RNA helicase
MHTILTQIYEVLERALKPYIWLVQGCVSGGERRKSEKARLRKGVTVLVSTPGRLLDHLRATAAFKRDTLRWLVMDEADRLMDLGYVPRQFCSCSSPVLPPALQYLSLISCAQRNLMCVTALAARAVHQLRAVYALLE